MNDPKWIPNFIHTEQALDQLKRKGVMFTDKCGDLSAAKNIGNKSLGRMDLLKRVGYFFVMKGQSNKKKKKDAELLFDLSII